jgi:hypothetical protein
MDAPGIPFAEEAEGLGAEHKLLVRHGGLSFADGRALMGWRRLNDG